MSPDTRVVLSSAKTVLRSEDGKSAFSTVLEWLLSILPYIQDISWEDIADDIADVLGEEKFAKYGNVIRAFFDLIKYAAISYTDDNKYDFSEIFGIVRRVLALISEIRNL